MNDNTTAAEAAWMNSPMERTPLPCPDWCTLRTGHGFDNFAPAEQGIFRYHERSIGHIEYTSYYGDARREDVRLVGEEHAAGNDGPVTRTGRPYLDSPEMNGLTGPQARELAAALVEAADLWDEATSS